MTTESLTLNTKWYEGNVPLMPLNVLRQHHKDLENKLNSSLPFSEVERLEITGCLKVLEKRMDELLPKLPAAIDAHDHFSGDRVKNNWPEELGRTSMTIHLHLCELIDVWRVSSQRSSTTEITVDEVAETRGRSVFVFGSKSDAGDFVDHFLLEDFLLVEPKATGFVGPDDTVFFYIELTNKFHRDDVNNFLEVYNQAIMALTVIYEERRRALSVDNGKYGFVTASHFSARETIELNKISAARQKLGLGFKLLNEL